MGQDIVHTKRVVGAIVDSIEELGGVEISINKLKEVGLDTLTKIRNH